MALTKIELDALANTVTANASSILSEGTVPLARLSSANTTANGVVDTTTQTLAGNKTFQNAASFSNTVSITGAVNTASTLGVAGTLSALGQLSVTGDASFGTATFNANTTTGVTANCKVTLNTTNGRFVLPVGVDKWSPS